MLEIGAVFCIAWGSVLLRFATEVTRFSRKAQGEFWGSLFTVERTRLAGCAFVLIGVLAAVTVVGAVLGR